MKKLILILASLILVKHAKYKIIIFLIPFFNSPSQAFFHKTAVEKCMDMFVDNGSTLTSAAIRCRGINDGAIACMKKLIKEDFSLLSSLRRCSHEER